jgi:hypothetical protein
MCMEILAIVCSAAGHKKPYVLHDPTRHALCARGNLIITIFYIFSPYH